MRPEILFQLFQSASKLDGVGPKILEKIAGLTGGDRLIDLIWHSPIAVIDRRFAPKLIDAPPGRVATLTVRVGPHAPPRNPKQPYKVNVHDDTAQMTLVFFNARGDYLSRMLPEGEVRVISGKVDQFGDGLQMTHPDHIVPVSELESVKTVEPVYPMTAGLSPKTFGKAMAQAVAGVPELAEWADQPLVATKPWPTWKSAIQALHHPNDPADLEAEAPARQRLAYDELLANQLALALVRRSMKKLKGIATIGDGSRRAQVLAALPFDLTGPQETCLAEITKDMASGDRMLRLLQGDVGSGKTAIALLAACSAFEAGRQAAVMAPTEILARQHLATLESLARAAGIETILLTGRDKGKARAEKLAKLASGEAGLAVGTHALLTEDVAFQDLALIVIDEQHRFGVHQRLHLAEKGAKADVLVMTATPIPRTLMLTAYGDMDVSKLAGKPPGRQPVDTRVLPQDRLGEVVEGLKRAFATGARAYWVCPLVEESESLPLTSAEDRFAHLSQVFGDRVGLVHGRMKGPEKDAVVEQFQSGAIDLLVATTVIEVGVNVPEATLMVVEHAERFGLAQLHQLRGRIGRGLAKSTCLLLYGTRLSETAKERLKVLRETDDGFVIAEQDLKLRGSGEILGTKQSGLPEFKLADLSAHADLLAIARDDATLLLNKDPDLTSERGQAVRTLLYLFERDAAVRTLRSG